MKRRLSKDGRLFLCLKDCFASKLDAYRFSGPFERGLPANQATRWPRHTALSLFASKLGAYRFSGPLERGLPANQTARWPRHTALSLFASKLGSYRFSGSLEILCSRANLAPTKVTPACDLRIYRSITSPRIGASRAIRRFWFGTEMPSASMASIRSSTNALKSLRVRFWPLWDSAMLSPV
jgi:hypothetical protein